MIEQLLLRTTSRRGFMWGAIVTGSGLLAAGCSGNSPREVQLPILPSPESRVSIKEVTSTLTKAEVRNLLEQLNPSPYKDFIMRYAYPLFQNNPPESITLAGEEIMVSDSRVVDKEEKGVVQGRASLRITQQGKRFRLQQDHTFGILLPHISEIPGHPLIKAEIDFRANQDFAEGIEPEISWVFPKDATIPLSEVNNYNMIRQSAIVKEAFGIGFLIAFMEEMIRTMKTQQMSIYFDDNGQRIEGISQALIVMINLHGKIAAISDLGPFVLAAKAIQSNQALISAMRREPRNIKTLDAISNRDFGNPNEMIGQTIDFILQNKDVVKGAAGHIGDLDQPY